MPRVFFDGACPLCAREIAFYQKQEGGSDITWVDVSRTDTAELPDGLSRDDALARFHVQTGNGELIDGAAAFAHLWTALPRFRRMGKFARAQPVLWILERLYNLFLPLRPHLQRWVGRRHGVYCDTPTTATGPETGSSFDVHVTLDQCKIPPGHRKVGAPPCHPAGPLDTDRHPRNERHDVDR